MSAFDLAVKVPTITTPSVAYVALLPIFIVLGAALLGVLVEAFVPRAERFGVQLTLALSGLVAGAITTGLLHNKTLTTPSPKGSDPFFRGSLAVDKAGLF